MRTVVEMFQQVPPMIGFYIWLPGNLGRKHRKILGHDQVVLKIGPIFSCHPYLPLGFGLITTR